MELVITCKSNIDLSFFMSYLLAFVKEIMHNSIDVNKVKIRDDKLNSIANLTRLNKISSLTVLQTAIENLSWKKTSNTRYSIELTKTAIQYGSSDTIYRLAKILEYGTIGLPPLNFFRNIYKSIEDNIQDIYDAWKESNR